jgi:hypothetical protein
MKVPFNFIHVDVPRLYAMGTKKRGDSIWAVSQGRQQTESDYTLMLQLSSTLQPRRPPRLYTQL